MSDDWNDAEIEYREAQEWDALYNPEYGLCRAEVKEEPYIPRGTRYQQKWTARDFEVMDESSCQGFFHNKWLRSPKGKAAWLEYQEQLRWEERERRRRPLKNALSALLALCILGFVCFCLCFYMMYL